MIISVTALSILVTSALIVTMITPIVLLALFIRDQSKGQIW